jgi:hypothetical protein
MSNAADQKKSRTRSPAYPAIGLEKAIQRAEALYKKEGQHLVSVDVACEHWGYKSGSSSGLQTVAALKQFQLVIEHGSKDSRQIRLSDRALELLNSEVGSPRWLLLVRLLALNPRIYEELWDKYGRRPPSDAILRRYLVVERKPFPFNKNYVDDFIDQYRATIAFARLDREDQIEPRIETLPNGEWIVRPGGQVDEAIAPEGKFSLMGTPPKSMRDLPITLPSLQVAVIRVPFPMDPTDYDAMLASLAAFKPALIKQPESVQRQRLSAKEQLGTEHDPQTEFGTDDPPEDGQLS